MLLTIYSLLCLFLIKKKNLTDRGKIALAALYPGWHSKMYTTRLNIIKEHAG